METTSNSHILFAGDHNQFAVGVGVGIGTPLLVILITAVALVVAVSKIKIARRLFKGDLLKEGKGSHMFIIVIILVTQKISQFYTYIL